MLGASCDDGDSATTLDVYDIMCQCSGQPFSLSINATTPDPYTCGGQIAGVVAHSANLDVTTVTIALIQS